MLTYDARVVRGVKAGPFQGDPPPRPGFYRLYHGTTVENAAQIVTEGFQPPDFDAILESVSIESDYAPEEILRSLAQGSFASERILLKERDVFFTDSPLWAADWAAWSGEALMETWCAVYRIKNPSVSRMTNEAQEWAVAKLDASPAVLAFDIPHETLVAAGNTEVSAREPEDRAVPIGTVALPSPASDALLVSHHQVERSLRWGSVWRRGNLDPYSADALIESGELPEPDDPFVGNLRWWESTLNQH